MPSLAADMPSQSFVARGRTILLAPQVDSYIDQDTEVVEASCCRFCASALRIDAA